MKPDQSLPPEPEEQYNALDARLQDFYDADQGGLNEEERRALLPIMNSLQDGKPRYEEIELIAEGAEKRISRVYDRRLNRQVAMARAVNAVTPEEQEQFLREAHIEANLSHPNIVQVYNIGQDANNIPFFTMELITGDSLKNIINRLKQQDPEYMRRYTLDHLLGIFLKICDAIAYAHSRNVLHLDLKPDNIRIGPFGEVFVCDWGLSIIIDSGSITAINTPGHLDGDILNDMTLTGIIKGTPGFMAPEQTVPNGEKTRQTDVYALGAMLYQILTLNPPVEGDSANAVLEKTREGKITPPRQGARRSRIPKGLAATAMKALSLNPEDRYSDAQQLQEEIVRHLSGYPTRAEKAGPTTLLALLFRRHSRTAAQLLFLLILIITLISSALVVIRNQKNAALAAKVSAENNFKLYREQQEEAQLLDRKLTDTIRYATYNAGFTTYDMLGVLEAGLKKPNLSEDDRWLMLMYKGRLHFIHEEFNAATRCFKEGGVSDSQRARQVAAIAEEMAWLKPDDYKLLTNAELSWLVHDTPHHIKILHHLYHHHMLRQKEVDPVDYLPLAQAMLEHINKMKPMDHPLVLEKRPGGWHLDLSGQDIFTFVLSDEGYHLENVLAPLKLNSLDISGIPLIDPAEMRNLNVRELIMCNMHITREGKLLYYLKELNLRKLSYNPDDFPPYFPERLRQENPDMEIIEIRTP